MGINKFLFLTFQNAGLFRRHMGTKDKSFEFNLSTDRYLNKNTYIEEFVEPITVQQISNMLHVLFGKRPVPMNRYVFYEKDNYLYEKANNSYLKISSVKDSNGEFIREKINIKKPSIDSRVKKATMYWERVKQYLGVDIFNDFVSLLKFELNIDIKNTSFYEAKKIIKNSNNQKIKEFVEKQKSGLKQHIYVLENESSVDDRLDKDRNHVICVFKSVDDVIRLSGEIIVPVSDEDLDIIRKNKGIAKLLDGGLVLIKKVEFANRVQLDDDFIPVNQISLQKQ